MGEASTPLSARPTPPDASVMTVLRRRVRSDRREEYETSLRRLLAAAQRLEGFLGAQVVRPPEGGRAPEYTSIFRFSTLEQLRRFEGSDLRARFLEEAAPLVEADAIWEHHTGLECAGAQQLPDHPPNSLRCVEAAERRQAQCMADKRWWAFDRPVLRDPLFLLALAAGVLVLCIATYRLATSAFPWGSWLWEGVGGAIGMWFTAGVILGTARNLVRGYRGSSEHHQGAHR